MNTPIHRMRYAAAHCMPHNTQQSHIQAHARTHTYNCISSFALTNRNVCCVCELSTTDGSTRRRIQTDWFKNCQFVVKRLLHTSYIVILVHFRECCICFVLSFFPHILMMRPIQQFCNYVQLA